jgi:hypothetical protein
VAWVAQGLQIVHVMSTADLCVLSAARIDMVNLKAHR